MKKLFLTSMLALAALAISTQPASAWTKFKFGIGANISYTGSGNSILWGAAYSSPFPDCGVGGAMPGCFQPTYGAAAYPSYPVNQAAPAATGAPASQVQPVDYWHGQGYQPANYYYPAYNYGYYAAPSYWYGR